MAGEQEFDWMLARPPRVEHVRENMQKRNVGPGFSVM